MDAPPKSKPNSKTHRDLAPENFLEQAEKIAEWIANYLENIRHYPVLAPMKPGDIKQILPESAPYNPESFQQILEDFDQIILPGITHWNHPRFFAYFSITGSVPGILGEMLSAALNVNAMLWKSSPAATELEQVVLDWLRQMLGLPETFAGLINDTASVSSLCAMAAAREAAGLNIREQGLAGRQDLPPLRFYASTEAHSSIEKSAIVLGFGQNGLCKIPTDAAFRMDASVLQQAIEDDIKRGIKPIGVIATLGTTSTTSVDPVAEIAKICQQYQLWLHVDAAYAGVTAILPEKRALFSDWEFADSIVVNPHKWLFTPIDCSVLYCRRPEVLRQAFSLIPEYLKTAESESATNLMDYGVSLGRRFRALKLWLVIRSFGQSGIIDAIREHIQFAQQLKSLIEVNSNFQLLAPVPFSTLVFRFIPRHKTVLPEAELTRLNQQLLENINQTGKVFLSHTVLKGKYGIRLAIGNLKTTWDDVLLAWHIIQSEAEKILMNYAFKGK